jgi:hypothetical protein
MTSLTLKAMSCFMVLVLAACGKSSGTADPGSVTGSAQTFAGFLGTPIAIQLSGALTGTGTLSYAVASQPAHGTISGTAPNLIYTPDDGYLGNDSFTFTASAGSVTSAPARFLTTVL